MIYTKTNIDIVKIIFEMFMAVSETNKIAVVKCSHGPPILA